MGTYAYDSQNRRTKKVAGGNTTQYVYGLDGLLYGEYDNSGTMIREYVYLDDQPLAQIDAGSPEVPTYLHPDHLGKPIYATNSGGTQVWAANSDAFGVGTPSGSRTVNIRMPGQYYDSESGLFYNWNRYYNPATGRYISSDPIGIDGGLNTYLYAEASPVMFTDPEGQLAVPLIYPIGIVVGGAVIGGTIAQNLPPAIPGMGLPGAIGGPNMSGTGQTAMCHPNDWVDDPEALAENQAYKKRYNSPNPFPDPIDPCDKVEYDVKRTQRLIADMKAWDAKWWPPGQVGRHAEAIRQQERALEKFLKKLSKCRKNNVF